MTLGTIAFGGTGWGSVVGQTDVEGARRQIAMARDAGVNLFDTADVYSGGLSEEILGKALGPDRDDVLIATKVRLPTGEGPNDAGLSRHPIMPAVDASLIRGCVRRRSCWRSRFGTCGRRRCWSSSATSTARS